MKLHNIALCALAVAFAAGCSPKNPPSGYGDNEGGDKPLVSAGDDLKNNPDGLFPRPAASGWSDPKNFNGDPNSIPEGAKLATVRFGFDKYTVESGERAKIDACVGAAKGKRIAAFGYTDYHGTEDYNLGLSDKRANSVKSYLAKVGGGEAEVRAYGEQFAKQSGDKAAVADDRKVILVDLDYKGN